MNKFESNQGNVINFEAKKVEQLKDTEEELRIAMVQATEDLERGQITEVVFDDLRSRYFIAKQEREDFEGKSKI